MSMSRINELITENCTSTRWLSCEAFHVPQAQTALCNVQSQTTVMAPYITTCLQPHVRYNINVPQAADRPDISSQHQTATELSELS